MSCRVVASDNFILEKLKSLATPWRQLGDSWRHLGQSWRQNRNFGDSIRGKFVMAPQVGIEPTTN